MLNRTRLLAGIALCAAMIPSAFADSAKPAAIPVSDDTFQCITDMTPVRGFYVANLTGKLEETVAVANASEGGKYPPGTVIQLVPGEAMVKQPEGTNPLTQDWEFFELDVDSHGTKIRKRGYTDVVNRFGGNCFACHAQAKPQWDLVCEKTHGCQPIPLTNEMFKALQLSDPRCSPANPLSDTDKKALRDLGEMMKQLTPPAGDAKQ